jgi:hypothetical protein
MPERMALLFLWLILEKMQNRLFLQFIIRLGVDEVLDWRAPKVMGRRLIPTEDGSKNMRW